MIQWPHEATAADHLEWADLGVAAVVRGDDGIVGAKLFRYGQDLDFIQGELSSNRVVDWSRRNWCWHSMGWSRF